MNNIYPKDQSPFYCLRSKKDLLQLLGFSNEEKLLKLTGDDFFIEVKKNGLTFTPPVKKLRHIHDRIQFHLSRIETSEYLHSATKKRSNLTNALSHSYSSGMVKTDIKSFFPSISTERVQTFFKRQMKCSNFVSKALSKLLTYKGELPKGSPCSPTLSFLVNRQMFDEINGICNQSNTILTVYVDDCSMSMPGLNRNLLRRVNGIINRHGYGHHKHMVYKPSQPKIITGVVLLENKIRAAKKIYKETRKHSKSTSNKGRLSYIDYVESFKGQF